MQPTSHVQIQGSFVLRLLSFPWYIVHNYCCFFYFFHALWQYVIKLFQYHTKKKKHLHIRNLSKQLINSFCVGRNASYFFMKRERTLKRPIN